MKKLPSVFYMTAAGNRPVRDFLLGLADVDRRIVGLAIARVEFGWPVGMPLTRDFGDIHEVRSTIKAGRVEARVYFGIQVQKMVLLHGHEGKDDQGHEIEVARRRWRDYMARMKERG